MPVRNFRHPFANISIFAIHFTPPGTLHDPSETGCEGLGKIDSKLCDSIAKRVPSAPEPDPKEDPEEFHKGPREAPLGEGGDGAG